jgi:CrcB protein
VTPLVVAAVLVAGALGSLLRYAVSLLFARRRFPWAVLVVNIAGSLVAGVALAVAEAAGSPELRLILITGFAGGLTTFSTLSVESMQLALERRMRELVLSVLGNYVLGLGAVALGWGAAHALLGR